MFIDLKGNMYHELAMNCAYTKIHKGVSVFGSFTEKYKKEGIGVIFNWLFLGVLDIVGKTNDIFVIRSKF